MESHHGVGAPAEHAVAVRQAFWMASVSRVVIAATVVLVAAGVVTALLTFRHDGVAGTTFAVRGGDVPGAAGRALGDQAIELRVDDSGRHFTARAGCNTIDGDVSMVDGAGTVSARRMTALGCSAVESRAEQWLFDVLSSDASATFDGRQMRIQTPDAFLVLAQMPPPKTAWEPLHYLTTAMAVAGVVGAALAVRSRGRINRLGGA